MIIKSIKICFCHFLQTFNVVYIIIAVRRYKKHDSRRWKHVVSNKERSETNNEAWKAMYIWSVTSISRLNKTEALINSHQVWLRYDSDMTQIWLNTLFLSQHSFLLSTSCSSTSHSFRVTNTFLSGLAQSLNIT